MSHPFGDVLSWHLHRKHGVSQAKLAEGILQPPQVISLMCQGQRLTGTQARSRVVAIIAWLRQEGVLTTRDEANALLTAAGMAGLDPQLPQEAQLLDGLSGTPSLPADPLPVSIVPLRSNLPLALTSFVGREQELGELQALLSRQRLITLTGAGGVGKTRLTLQLATIIEKQFVDGVRLVELAPLSDPALVLPTVAAVYGVPNIAGQPLLERLVDVLRPQHTLLLLDNCEHLVDAAAALAQHLLKACPRLVILAASREPLGITGEVLYRVPSLSVPNHHPDLTPEQLLDYSAVQLLVDRTVAIQSHFALTQENAPGIAQICRRLDGIPLAIELAAARLRHLPVAQLAARLDNMFQLLTAGSRTALPRHQTLRAMIDWSYDLLSDSEQLLFQRLAIFHGGWTLEAAESICSGAGLEFDAILDLLSQLVDKSLVIVEETESEVRYRMLEPVRQYATEKLQASGEMDDLHTQHLAYFLTLVGEAEPQLLTGDQLNWFARLEREHDNLRAALAWAQAHDPVAGLQLAGMLWFFWYVRDYRAEGLAWLDTLLPQRNTAPEAVRAKALACAAFLACETQDREICLARSQEGYMLARRAGDVRTMALLIYVLAYVGGWSKQQGLLYLEDSMLEESLALARKQGDTWSTSLLTKSLFAKYYDRPEQHQAFFLEALALVRQSGERWLRGYILNLLAQWTNRFDADPAAACAYMEERVAIARELGDRTGEAHGLEFLGRVTFNQSGDYRQAQRLLEESLAMYRGVGNGIGLSSTLCSLGHILLMQGDTSRARSLFEESLAIRKGYGIPALLSVAHYYLARVTLAQSEYSRAVEHAQAIFGIAEQSGSTADVPAGILTLILPVCAELALIGNQPVQAARLLGAIEGVDLNSDARGDIPRLTSLIQCALDEEAFTEAVAAGRAMSFEQAIQEAAASLH